MRNRTAALLLVGTIALTGCSGSEDKNSSSSVPTPVATIPVAVAGLSQGVGEYVVTPKKDLDVDASVAALKKMAGVQAAKLTGGKIHVEILPSAKTTEREAILRQLAALGDVAEGI